MPMNDVVRDEKSRPPRFTKLGVVRLGYMVPNRSGEGTHPEAADHFVLTDAEWLKQFYGEKPKELPIRFAYADFDDNIYAFWQIWAGGVRVCEGDGDYVRSALPMRAFEDDKGKLRVHRAKGYMLVDHGVAVTDFEWGDHTFQRDDVVPCPGRARDRYPHCALCSSNILIKFMVDDPDRDEAFRFGYYQVATRSLGNYRHFLSVWDLITESGKYPVAMDKIPFKLRVVPLGTLRFDAKEQQWMSGENYFLQLEVDPAVARAINKAQRQNMLAQLAGGVVAPVRIALPAPELMPDEPPNQWVEEPVSPPPLSPEELEQAPFPGEDEPSPREFLDRSKVPADYTKLYTLANQVGMENKKVWEIIKEAYPDATARKPPPIEASWRALLDNEAPQIAKKETETE